VKLKTLNDPKELPERLEETLLLAEDEARLGISCQCELTCRQERVSPTAHCPQPEPEPEPEPAVSDYHCTSSRNRRPRWCSAQC